jgi:hypothetical protein
VRVEPPDYLLINVLPRCHNIERVGISDLRRVSVEHWLLWWDAIRVVSPDGITHTTVDFPGLVREIPLAEKLGPVNLVSRLEDRLIRVRKNALYVE